MWWAGLGWGGLGGMDGWWCVCMLFGFGGFVGWWVCWFVAFRVGGVGVVILVCWWVWVV